MIDIIYAILIITAIVKGYQKGLIVGLFSILALIVGLAAALKLSAVVAVRLQDNLSVSSKWLPFISFALVFLLVVMLVQLGARLIQKSFEMVMLGWINRLGGILLYMAMYTVVYSVFLFYAEKTKIFEPASFQASTIYPFVQPLGPKIINGFGQLVPIFKDTFAQLEQFFESVSDKIEH